MPSKSAKQARLMAAASHSNLPKNEDAEEKAFQKWIRSTEWFNEFVKQYGEEPDLSKNADYDYRAAWKAGIKPERYEYDDNRYHWPSSLPTGEMLKSESHPTAWKEYFMRDTGLNPDKLGIKTKEQADIFIQNSIGRKGK
jgi:hypothetical protein